MPDAVTSGLGRNGPWLQNHWLRVETRQSDGSISPVALEGAFRPTERAVAFVAPVDAPPIEFGRCDYDVRPHEDALGVGRILTLVSHISRRGVTLRREVALYDAHPFCVTRVGITNEGAAQLPLAAIHAFTVPAEGRGRLQLKSKPADLRVYRHGWQSWSPTLSLGGAGLDLRSPPPVQAPEPPEQNAGRFASDDVAVLYDPASGRSLLTGAITASDFLTQVFVDAPSKSLDARSLADGILLAPGDTLWSERIAVDLIGSPQDQLERYGDALARSTGARVPQKTPSGWCSWYYFYTTVTEADVVRNLRFLEQHRRELPIETVQIDDGYQADIGDWLITNEKFPHGMAWLASEIKRAGYTPGLWLAPFLAAETSRTFAEHPNFFVRRDDGEPALAIHNWNRRNFGLDGSNPDARDWLKHVFREVCETWGYDYVKVDFLYAAAIAGRRHDSDATRARAYRQALAAVREAVGDDRFILGCGSLIAPSVGAFDGNRIGQDVGPWWRNLRREDRGLPSAPPREPDDNSSAEVSIRNTMTRWWMHGRLWANDPDCLIVREARSKLSLDETRTLAAAIGLSAGMMLSSDDLDQLPCDRLELISMLLPPLPRSARPLDLMERDIPEHFEVTFDGADGPTGIAAVFNFDDAVSDRTLPLPDGRWHAVSLWDERYLGEFERDISFPAMPPHSSHVVSLRPADLHHPALLATTAHIGMGALDVADANWSASSSTLRLDLDAVGRARRRIFFATAGRTPSARLGAATLQVHRQDDVAWVDASIDSPTTLDITFAT